VEVSIWVFLLLNALKVIVVTVILLLCVAYTVLLERKVVGRIQNRWGPSRVGPFGLLQPVVDGAKLFLKEDLLPTSVYRPLFILAPIISLSCALISISMVPFAARWFFATGTLSAATTTRLLAIPFRSDRLSFLR